MRENFWGEFWYEVDNQEEESWEFEALNLDPDAELNLDEELPF